MGEGFFQRKGSWGCETHKGILFRTSSLAKGILLNIFCQGKAIRLCFLAILFKERADFGNRPVSQLNSIRGKRCDSLYSKTSI